MSVRGVHEEQEVSERIDVKKMEVEVGRLMLRVPIVASALGHESPGITAINYLDREGWPGSRESALAAEFISDFIECARAHGGTRKLIDKWYGGKAKLDVMLSGVELS